MTFFHGRGADITGPGQSAQPLTCAVRAGKARPYNMSCRTTPTAPCHIAAPYFSKRAAKRRFCAAVMRAVYCSASARAADSSPAAR